MTLTWQTMRRDRRYFPATIEGTQQHVVALLTILLSCRSNADFRIEQMTDQIDVYVNGRKLAVYMII